MSTTTRRSLAYGLACLVVFLDQLSKAWIARTISVGGKIVILPFFNLTCLHNQGAAFSFLGAEGALANALFLTLACLATLVFVVWIWRITREASHGLAVVGLGLVLGGTVGNGIDRIRHGYVIDFLQFHLHGWYYPAFNLADSALTVGAVLLVLGYLRPRKPT